MGFDPTAEQQAAVDAFSRGDHLAIVAGAGTGKTSTLRFLSGVVPDKADGSPRTGVYMAYNASIAKEASTSFPANTICKTGHAHAMTGMTEKQRDRLFNMPRQTSRDTAMALRTQHAQITDEVKLTDRQVASVTMETIDRFARSGDPEVRAFHVPHRPRLEDPAAHAALASIVLPFARRAWADVCSEFGRLKWTFDYPRKMFQLDQRRLPGDFLFLDEAQDSNGVTIAIVKHQQTYGTRVVAVGDENQAINGWMGAVDAMDRFGGTRLTLSKSFRFGPAIAGEANKFLTLLDADLRISGHDPVGSVVRHLADDEVPNAILTRKNATAFAEAMRLNSEGVRVALVKTVGDQIVRLARAAQALKDSKPTDHPELTGFATWGEVQEYVENDHGGSDLKVFVDLIDSHGADTIVNVVGSFPAPSDAGVQCVVSTAHRAKGLEWDSVRIASDFELPVDKATGEDRTPERDELMLAYVAVTRAKKVLDRGGLAWVDRLLNPPTKPAPGPAVKHDPWAGKRDTPEYVVIKAAVDDMDRGLGLKGAHLREVS